jgi:ComF family protein
MPQKKIDYLKKMFTWLLPYTCVLCHHTSDRYQDLCAECYKTLPWLQQHCLRCGIPLFTTEICGHCLQKIPSFDTTHALFLYQTPITQLILELKFKQSLINAQLLGELLTAHIQHIWYQTAPLPDVIIPIPLHPERLKERGYNQALEIARPISKSLQIPINTMACQRIKATTPQTILPAKERQQNIKNAFTVSQSLAHRHVAVIDDVITTGYTISEFCKTLKQNGVRTIDVWCCARAGIF